MNYHTKNFGVVMNSVLGHSDKNLQYADCSHSSNNGVSVNSCDIKMAYVEEKVWIIKKFIAYVDGYLDM